MRCTGKDRLCYHQMGSGKTANVAPVFNVQPARAFHRIILGCMILSSLLFFISVHNQWAKVRTMSMEFAPGERFSYNQTNYLLLGRVIDKLTNQPFTEFIAVNQFQAVGMPLTARAGFSDSYDVIPHSARGYTYFRTGSLSNVFEGFPPSLRTAAGMSTAAEELALWIIALQKRKLLKKKDSFTAMWTPAQLNDGSTNGFSSLLNGYALGFPTVSRNEHPAVAGVGGGRSAFFIYPDDDLAVVILTNLQGASPESFIDKVAGFYFPDMKAETGF